MPHVYPSSRPCLFATHTENVAIVGVGGTGELDARDRHTCMRGIYGDDCFVELEITILVVGEGRPATTEVGAVDRTAQDPFWMQAALAIAPIKAVVAERLRTPIGKVDGAASH